jgi:hypothetical protein
MRLPVLALMATFLSATLAGAEGVSVEQGGMDSAFGITVSWPLPPGFEESELLLEIEGGPRVRLTGELRGRHPRVVVNLPALAGSARFVVRAGREGEGRDANREEVDVATSPSFALAGLRTTGRAPVRAVATRPVPGAAMEWWADASGRPVEGPSPTVAGPVVAEDADEPLAAPALPSSRPVPAVSASEAAAGPGDPSPAAALAARRGLRERAFAGAATPLRN